MNKLQELQKWESSGANFHRGVELCKKHGIRPDLTNGTFTEGAIRGNKRLLLQVLTKEIAALTPPEAETTAPFDNKYNLPSLNKIAEMHAKLQENFGMRVRYPNLNLGDAPDFIKLMFSEALATWNDAVKAHDEKLIAAETDEDRFAIMTEIMTAIEANDAAHKELRHFTDTGTILGEHPKHADFVTPSEDVVENHDHEDKTNEMSGLEKEFRAMTPQALLLKRNNLRSQISRARKKLEATPDDESLKTKLADLETAEKLASLILDM